MTPRQRQLRKRYTHIVRVRRGEWRAFLNVGDAGGCYQEFCVCDGGTRREAEFMAAMVAKAIERLLTMEGKR